jgi:glycosyltransferase involved in cell wall biosynthesis
METRSTGTQGILALLPFLVTGALSLAVLRAMRDRGLDVCVGSYVPGGGGYTPDAADDLKSEDRLIDMSASHGPDGIDALVNIVRKRSIGVVLQIGSPWAYDQLPYLKERHPGLRVVDILYNKIGHTLNHFLYEACFDGVIVESQDMLQYVLDCTAKRDPRVRKVESGIDLERFTCPAGKSCKGNGLVVGYFGRMSPEKNPLGFVELAERLHGILPSLSFCMFGEGSMAEDVRARINAGSAAGAIRFGGYVDYPTTALAQMDVLVVPSKLDGRPMVVMEANAFGVPVIGAPVGGIPELIEPGCNGFVFAPEEHDKIAKILADWMEDAALFNRIIASCRATAETRFDRRRMLDDYEAVFREFLTLPTPQGKVGRTPQDVPRGQAEGKRRVPAS